MQRELSDGARYWSDVEQIFASVPDDALQIADVSEAMWTWLQACDARSDQAPRPTSLRHHWRRLALP